MSCREKDLEKIKMALNENPKMNAIELARKTDLPAKTIIDFLNDGTLTPIDEPRKKNIKVYYSPKEVQPKWHINIDNFSKK